MTSRTDPRPTVTARTSSAHSSPDAASSSHVTRRRVDRVMARVLAHRLDLRLARGAAPEGSRLLSARASLITSWRFRAGLADAWYDVLDDAGRPRAYLDTRVPVARPAVLTARSSIAALAAALRGTAPIRAGDVARITLHLGDGRSALHAGGDLERQIEDLLAGLQSRREDPQLLPTLRTLGGTIAHHGRAAPRGRGRG